MQRLRLPVLLAVCLGMLPATGMADDGASVDAMFDKTGDGIVNGADWKQLSDADRESYARQSLQALGEDPYASVREGEERWQLYLRGLRRVYE